jgi:hypothetical protein
VSARAPVWPLVAITLVAGGCASMRSTYKLVEPGVRTMGDAYTVQPRMAWSVYRSGKLETWTIDGFALETLRFFKGVDEGEPLIRGGANEALRARFHGAMTMAEVSEFVAESLFGSRFPPRNVRPAPFGGADGFRFEVSYGGAAGVKREAIVAGAVLDKRLHVIAYEGTALYHFGKYRDEVEHILGSVHLRR